MAPGRCTVVGDHVDYSDGLVLAVAVDRAVAVAVRPSRDGRWRVASGPTRVERNTPHPAGDPADRALATCVALGGAGLALPPLELGVAASLPAGAGLSSSAALACATVVAVLRLLGQRRPAAWVAAVALAAERDVLGIPVGPLDQRAVVGAPRDGALLLDCAPGGTDTAIPWAVGDAVLVVCDTGEAHDTGGSGYRSRGRQAAEALARLGAGSYRDVTLDAVERSPLPGVLLRRARHTVTETARAAAAATALAAGDAVTLGRLMSASGRSLRDDFEVTTAALDRCVEAALGSPGCLGARMVGAGFGGSAVALTSRAAAAACAAAMRIAVGGAGQGAWVLRPSGGVAALAPDAVETRPPR